MPADMLRSAISQLRLKLLDLTGRNRLINFKHSPGKSLQFVGGSIADVVGKLLDEGERSAIPVLPLPEPPASAYVRRAGRLEPPDPAEWARRQQISTSYEIEDIEEDEEDEDEDEGRRTPPPVVLQTLLFGEPLGRHCRKLEREAVLAIEETGANMLFLVAGMLEFPDQKDSERSFSAPLICIPVVFKSVARANYQSFSIQSTGEEITENLSLREKLRNDYDITLPEFNDEDLDIASYFAAIEAVIGEKPGFELHHTLSLCLLSFSSMLMVRDLDPDKWPVAQNGNGLIDHPVVKTIFEGSPDSAAGDGYSFAEEYAVEEGEGAAIPLVYDADSSQHSALIDVLAKKRNLVIEGPPGTGKSQTITNLIAASIASGKTVLFVAEKLAALQVVQSRLDAAGLGPFILELHSSKSNKKQVIESLGQRLDLRPRGVPPEWKARQEQLEGHRRALREYADAINSVAHNAMGLTLHQVMWRAERHRAALSTMHPYLSTLSILGTSTLSTFEYSQRSTCLKAIADQYELVGGFNTHSPFWGFYPKNLVQGDEVAIRELLRDASAGAKALEEITRRLVDDLSIPVNSWPDQIDKQAVALKEFKEGLDRSLPLTVISRFFKAKEAGQDPRKILTDFRDSVDRYNRRIVSIERVLKTMEPDQFLVERLTDLTEFAGRLSVPLGTVDGLSEFERQLSKLHEDLKAGLQALERIAKGLSIDVAPRQSVIRPLLALTAIVEEPIDDCLHLWTREIARPGVLDDLKDMEALQHERFELEKQLGDELYLDALPPESDVAEAVRVLRRGNRWYRLLQKDWRDSIRLHRELQRNKVSTSPDQRLADLETLLRWSDVKARFVADRRWETILGLSVPAKPYDLISTIRLADWNVRLQKEAMSLGAELFSPDRFDGKRLQQIRTVLRTAKPVLETAATVIDKAVQLWPRLPTVVPLENLDELSKRMHSVCDRLAEDLPFVRQYVHSDASINEALTAAIHLLQVESELIVIRGPGAAAKLLGAFFNGESTDIASLLRALEVAEHFESLNIDSGVRRYIKDDSFPERLDEIAVLWENMSAELSAVKVFEDKLKAYGSFDLEQWAGQPLRGDLRRFAQDWRQRIDRASESVESIIPWSIYVARRDEGCAIGLSDLVWALETGKLPAKDLRDGYAYLVYTSIARTAFQSIPCLARFSGLMHSQIRVEFQKLDREIIALRGQAIAAQLCASSRPPLGRSGVRVGDKTEMSLINHLLPQQRPRVPLRRLVSRAPKAIQTLKPCFMMGPQAVAQYLAPDAIKFDLVIMDEASQLRPEEAIGTVARGGQLVVVGDPKQLPPTSFFARTAESADETQYTTTDAESILDICAAQFQPMRTLRWHYRSQHQSLIAFSNKNFYDGKLVIFPSPYGQGGALGVRAIYLADAVYENQTNAREAKRVVDAVAEHIRLRPNESLGIVTLNLTQRDLISEYLEERLSSIQGAEAFRERWKAANQGLFVKNLENVQGDERDTIIISTTFGRAPGTGVVRQNFGPISRDGGWRRLNVLFTRARRSVLLVTSMRPEDIVVEAKTPAGTRALKGYLEYARSGSLVAPEDTGAEPDSEFEVAVMNVLAKAGYEVTPQLGVAGYRIDIGVKHPKVPGAYLAAIECDGASYHSAASSRDRDRIRQEILESLGWKGRIWRIWSTDWFRSPAQEIAKLQEFLDDLSKTWRPEHAAGQAWTEEGVSAATSSHGASRRVSRTPTPAPPNEQEPKEVTRVRVGSYTTNLPSYLEERQEVNRMLVGAEDILEVAIGDLVTYTDLSDPKQKLQIRIVRGTPDPARGIVNEKAPIAVEMLGAVVGDELDVVNKRYRVLKIERPN